MKKQKIESIYPLSPMQQGLLFHSLYEGGRGTYYEQMSCRIEGDLNVEAFKRAWQAVVDRHAILRTSFVWEGLKEPVQVVQQGLKLDFREEDWRGSTRLEQSRKLEELLKEEREEGFDLTKAPLMKLGMVRVAEKAYCFIWVNHHILFDGWCRELIIGEVFKMYEGYSRGVEVEMERVRPYRDYIAWLGERNLSEAEEFWREELRGIEGPTELRIEQRGGREEGEYEEKNVRLSEETSRRLEEEARKWQVTLNTVVEGAWAVVMSRYSGQGEVVFGTTVSGRGGGLKGIEGMVGLFINILPVRVEVRGEERVKELMRRVQEKQSKVLEYEYSPLMEVQGWSEVPRGVPLFRAAFMFQNYPLDAGIRQQAISGLRIDEAQRFSNNNYELVTRAVPGTELLLNAIYDGGRFEASDMERLLNHLKRVLEGITENAQSRVIELPMMSEQEREEVIVEWNQTTAEYPRDRCVHELCEQQVDLTPDAVAVVYEGEHLSYHELNRRANQLAHYLREMGVGAEVKVGLCVERSLEMIVALLGVMKAGGAYLPLDAGYPRERLAYMIEDSGCPVIVATKHLLEQLPVTWAQIVMIDDDWPAIAVESDGNPEVTTVSANLAYMIYTSGSTGKPKGVGLTHQGLCNLTVAQNRNLQVAAGASVLQFASFSFDAATWDWLMTLTCGAKLILISEADAQLPEKILELIVKHGVETVTLPPSVLMSAEKEPIPTLKTMIVAGEACPNELVRQWSGECRFVNAYGPTESTVCATMTGAIGYGEKAGIGRANENTQIYILGRNQKPMPVGVTGEIYIAGAGLARGYLNRSDLTAEKFKANPFASGERMYRSGDLGRYHRDGSIECLGRVDDQVKIRGYRIELGEIEAVLNEHPSVTQAIIIAREDEPGEKRLVGYVVGQQQVSSQGLREYLKERLPDYMVPGAIVQLDAMPLTPNGKIDRRALPKPELGGAGLQYVGPRTAVEEIVCGIWAEVLRIEKVGIHDNFFELGGHSLLATQVVSRVRKLLGVEVSLRKLFTDPTAAAMAGEVEQQRREGVEAAVEAIGRVGRDRELPLSYAQQRLWFIDQLEPGSAAYNIPCAVRLRGRLDEQALRRSLNEIVRRHEVLRTSFPSRDGEPRQQIHELRELEPDIIELTRSDEAEREEKLQEILRAEARRGFDLTRGPLIRAKLIRMAEDEQVLMVNMHHIVSDGWSMEIIVREFAQLYEAFTQGRESELPELEIQYADYAMWQREWLQGEVLESRLQYWREQLEGVAVLDLPTDRARPNVTGYRGACERFQLSEELSGKLKQLSRREGVTLFMSLLVGFQVLLARYSGQEDIAVGTPIAGRNRGEIEGLIGFFVNTLVMRMNVGGNPTVRELLGRVREAALGAYAHQDLPFEKLVEELQPDRSLSHTPLFQVMIAMQNVPREALAISGLILKGEPLETESAKFELTLTIVEGEREISLEVKYARELYEGWRIRRLLEHLEHLLEGMIENEQRRVMELPLMSEEERQQVIEAWNETGADFPADQCMHELFEQQVVLTADAVAVVHEGEQLTYDELNRRANQLAHYLREMGVGAEVKVGLCVERSLEMIVGLVGIMKAGGAYLPIDPGYPAERIRYMLRDSGAKVALVQGRFRELVGEICPNIVELEQTATEVKEERGKNLEVEVSGENLAYIIYTSGSTGQPKGCEVNHRNVARLLKATETFFQFNQEDVWTLFHSYTFDFSVWEIWGALAYGGRLIVVPQGVTQSLEKFHQLLCEQDVTVLNQTPMAFRHLLQVDTRIDRATSALRWVIFGGDVLDFTSLQAWFERYGDERPTLVNMYGITETTVHVTHYVIRREDAEESTSRIGRQLADLRLYILDRNLDPTPIGVAGELFIGGAGVARGYSNRGELTAERFIPDRFSQRAGARLYRTGDLARYLADGQTEYLGRLDNQVKIRGYRIELGEIEAAINEYPSVEQAIVIAREDEPGEKRLVGYVVGRQQVTGQQMREYLQARLPDYMVPGTFVQMEEMPLTANGKLDRRALPKPELSGAVSQYVGTWTAVEEIVCGIYAEVLRVEKVGIHDNFFELGGHSLLATQVVSRVRSTLGVEVRLRALFTNPTVAAFAAEVEQQQHRIGEASVEVIARVARDRDLPLSFAQQRLWFIQELEPESSAYNIPSAMRIEGALDTAALRQSLREIARRHEVLRTSFPAPDGEPVQHVGSAEAMPLTVVDLSGLAEVESVARRLAVEEARRPFDLAAGPLLRVTLLRLGERDHVLLASMHHAVTDMWSVGILVREFTTLYKACRRGDPSPLPELSIQYADYAVWQRQQLQGEALEQQLAYWRERLEGLRPLEVPADRKRPPTPTHKAGVVGLQLGAELTEALRALSRREGVTLFMTMLAAFQVLLARYSGQPDIAVGTPIAGRNRREIEGLIGFFVNALVMRVDVDGNQTVRELLGRVRETALGAYAHQNLPFEKLVEELQPERSLSRTPLFQVVLSMQNVTAERPVLSELSIEMFPIEDSFAKFDLILEVSEGPEGVAGSLQYSTDLFERNRIERMLSHLKRVLEGMAEYEQCQVMELPLMSEKERQEVIVEWNQTQAEFSQDVCIHTLFERQTERSPDAVAAVFESQLMSYRGLNRLANQLAHHLKSRGVGRGKLVAIYMERSLEMLTALLGTLKVGGVYVPLDISFPEGRLEYILNSLQVGCLITQAGCWEKLERMRSRLTALREVVCLGAESQTQNDDGQVRVWQESDFERQIADNLDPQAGPDDLSYIIFTSGSTGRPKGVTLQHGPVVNLIEWVNRIFSVKAGDRVLFITSLCFDLSVYDIFGLLAAGGTIHVAGEEQIRDPQCLLDLLCREHVTFWDSAPAALQQLTPFFTEAKQEIERNQLRLVFLSGDWIPVRLPDQVREVFTKAKVVGLGGATEAAIWSNFYPVSERSSGFVSIPYGKPIQNSSYYILDDRMRPCPVGVRGDLYIGGECLALGYINEPSLTAERFLPNPYKVQGGARLYKTGDLARWRADGNIEFLGRADHQVKIRGYRIELGEIEAALNQHASVEQVVVLAREDEPGEKWLVAYVVGNQRVSGKELREYLQEILPDYMVPGAFVQMEEMPLTDNGKLDRRALPKPELSGASAQYAGPRTAVEEIVCGIYAEVLRVEKVGIHDNFFEMGGHSLLATQVVSRVRSTLGVEVRLRALFTNPTVAAFAPEVEQQQHRIGEAPVDVIARVARDRDVPLSFAQQRLWFIDQFEPGSAAYNIPCAVRLSGGLDADALSRSLSEIIARHEVLRTDFLSRDGEPRQEIHQFSHFEAERIDLRQVDEAEREQKLQEVLRAEVKRGFDLSSGPLIRAKLIRLAEDEHVLIVNMHHIVTDAWSLEVIVREFAQLYEAFSRGQESPLPELEIQYADYAMWQRAWLQGVVLDHQLQYWRRQLEGLGILELPTDRPRPPASSYRGASERILLSEELTQKLKRLSQREGVTVFMSLLAGFQVLLARYSGQLDIAVGTPIAGRNREETEGLIGLFLNTLVMRVNVGGNPSVSELLARVREAALGAYAHQDLPFEKLVEEIRPERSLSHQPLFQVWFVLQNIPAERIDLPGLRVEMFPIEDSFTKFDLMLSFSEGQKELTGTLRYSTDLFDRRRIKRMLSHYESILEGMAADEKSHSRAHDIEGEYQYTAIA